MALEVKIISVYLMCILQNITPVYYTIVLEVISIYLKLRLHSSLIF